MDTATYSKNLRNYMQSPEFLSMDDAQQQVALEQGRSNFVADFPEVNTDDINSITEYENKSFLRGTGKGRALPIININYPSEEKGWEDLSKDDKITKIEEFKLKIPELANAAPTQKEDLEYAIGKGVQELERRTMGEDVSKARSLGASAMQGFALGLVEAVNVGGLTETAADGVKGFFNENTEFDEDFSTQLAAGLGDLGSSTAIFVGIALTTKGLGGAAATGTKVATATSLATNGIRRYNDAYKQAIDAGLDDGNAIDAGISALPGAAVDVLGDRIIGMKFLPDNTAKILRTGAELKKKAIIKELIKDNTTRQRILKATGTAFAEGSTEVAGDYISGYNAYLTTGIDDFIPTNEEIKKSFQIGAILGGGVSVSTDTKGGLDYVGDKTNEGEVFENKTIRDITIADKNSDLLKQQEQQQVFNLMNQGKYSQAMKLSNELLAKPAPPAPVVTPVDIVIPEGEESTSVSKQFTGFDFVAQPTNSEAYDLITRSVFGSDKLFSGTVTEGELNEGQAEINIRLDTVLPSRSNLYKSIDSDPLISSLQQEEKTSFKTVLDTVAARWASEKPQTDINQFYDLINNNYSGIVEPIQTMTKMFQSSGPKINDLMDGMIKTLRSTGVIKDILTEPQYETLKKEIGVQEDFTTENDTALSNRFQAWLGGQESQSASVFQKLKDWTIDLYKTLKQTLGSNSSQPDSIFENLMQVKLTPREFNKVSKSKSSVAVEPVIETAPTSKAKESSEKILEESRKKARAKIKVAPNIETTTEESKTPSTPRKVMEDLFGEDIPASLKQMLNDVERINPDVKIVINPKYETKGSYNGNTNIITLRDLSLRTAIHELGHAVTKQEIRKYIPYNPQTEDYKTKIISTLASKETPDYIKTIIDSYLESAKYLDKESSIGNGSYKNIDEYRFYSVDEFISEALASQEFQEQLSNIPYGESNVWKNIVDAITKAFTWISSYANPEIIMRSKGENALAATLQAYTELVENAEQSNTDELININYLPITQEQDEVYARAVETGDTTTQDIMLQTAAANSGYDSFTDYWRGDTNNWAEPNRPTYLTESYDLAYVFAKRNEIQNTPRKFWIKKDIKLAKIGDVTNGVRIKSSSYFMAEAQRTQFGQATGVTATSLRRSGFDGIAGIIDGSRFKEPEIVLINASDMKLASRKTYDEKGNLIPLSKRFNPEITNINYLPDQVKGNKNREEYKRYRDIIRGRLNDKTDSKTVEIIKQLSYIKPNRVDALVNEDRDLFFTIVDNIYESRKNAVESPQIRFNSEEVLEQIKALQELVNANEINTIIDDYQDIIDFDSANIDMTDVTAVYAFVNEQMNQLEQQGIIVSNTSTKRKERLDRINAKYREKYNDIRKEVSDRFVDADNYVSEIESIYGQTLPEGNLKEYLKAHFNYIQNVNVEEMENGELYRHFYAVNNMYDNNFTGMGDITSKHIAYNRNNSQNVSYFALKFRDPFVKGRISKALDKGRRYAELIQVQSQRLTAWSKPREFIQEDLLGPITEAVIGDSFNRKNELWDVWTESRTEFEKASGRDYNVEDRATLSIVGRLLQFPAGSNPDTWLAINIKKERQSLEAVVKYGDEGNIKLHIEKILPIFESITKDANEGQDGSMVSFIQTLDKRMSGTESEQIGALRKGLLETEQDIFSRFSLESRIISEGFFKQPYSEQSQYITNNVQSFDTSEDKKDENITDPVGTWGAVDNRPGVKSKASHFYERQTKLGEQDHYSYNNEYIINRGIENLCVESSTVSERFILAERLKRNSDLDLIIGTDEFGDYRPERSKFLIATAKKIVSNAVSRGEPSNIIVSGLRNFTSLYAIPTLSGLHHIVTQPLAAVSDYAIRYNNLSGWMDAMKFYTMNSDKVEAWLKVNSRWTGQRGALEAMSLDQRRSPGDDNGFSKTPMGKKLNSIYDKATEIITVSLRTGDRYSAKATVLAEYVRLLKQKGHQIRGVNDIDWDNVEGNILSQAVLNAEKVVNTSNKILRGDLFTDRDLKLTVLRNMMFAFSSHSSSMATQMQQAWRDLRELKALDAPTEEIESKIRVMGGILAQSITFTTARFAIGTMIGKALLSLVQDLFDDEEGKIEDLQHAVYVAREKGDKVKIAQAENELAQAKTVRSVITKIDNRTSSSNSWFSQVIRDVSGSIFMSMSNGVVSNFAFKVPDVFAESYIRSANEKIVEGISSKIKLAKEKGDMKLAAKLEEQKVVLDAAEYIPLGFDNVGGMEVGGVYGSALGQVDRNIDEITKEYSWNDFVIAANMFGIGQSEVNKFLKAVDAIEDEQFKRQQEFENKKLPAVKLEAEESDKKKSKRLLDSILR